MRVCSLVLAVSTKNQNKNWKLKPQTKQWNGKWHTVSNAPIKSVATGSSTRISFICGLYSPSRFKNSITLSSSLASSGEQLSCTWLNILTTYRSKTTMNECISRCRIDIRTIDLPWWSVLPMAMPIIWLNSFDEYSPMQSTEYQMNRDAYYRLSRAIPIHRPHVLSTPTNFDCWTTPDAAAMVPVRIPWACRWAVDSVWLPSTWCRM